MDFKQKPKDMVISGPTLPPRDTSGSEALLWPGSVWMSTAHLTTEDHADARDMSTWSHFDAQGHAAAKGHDVGGLHCYLRPYRCLWSRQTSRVLPEPMVLLQLGPCSWSVVSPEPAWRPMAHAPLILKSMEAAFAVISMTTDSQLRRRDMEGFYNPYPHPKPPPQKNR